MKKYHADIHMPKSALDLAFATLLTYTRHALEAARSDRYGRIDLPKVFDSRKAKLIEAVLDGGRIVKTLWRQSYDDLHDLSIVLDPNTGKVITVWLNEADDDHSTLRAEQYATN